MCCPSIQHICCCGLFVRFPSPFLYIFISTRGSMTKWLCLFSGENFLIYSRCSFSLFYFVSFNLIFLFVAVKISLNRCFILFCVKLKISITICTLNIVELSINMHESTHKTHFYSGNLFTFLILISCVYTKSSRPNFFYWEQKQATNSTARTEALENSIFICWK